MAALDRRSPVPLWAQLADGLRAAVAAGEFADHFPTELELVETYGVSRNTVREALRRLRDEGLVERQRGRGTSITGRTIEQPIAGLYSLARTIQAQGLDERSEVVTAATEPAGDHGPVLGLDPSEPVVRIERIRFAGDEPLAIDRSWLPARFAHGLLDADLTRGSLYDEVAERHGARATGGEERITPCVPDLADRRTLGLRRGRAAFRIERVVTTTGGVPLEHRISVIHGDRYTFVARWP